MIAHFVLFCFVRFFFADVHKVVLKFTWKCKGLRIARQSLRKKLENFVALLQDRIMNQWKKIEKPEIDPHI